MLTSPSLLLGPAYGVPHHIMGHNNATTPVGMYLRDMIGPLEAIDVIQCDKANQLVCNCLVECSPSPNLLLGPAFSEPHHIPGHNNATTSVGMYFRYRIGPLDAIDVIQCDKANQLRCICLVECSLAPIFCSDLLMVCITTYRT